ncbi:MAG: hydroxyisourate hydrolase [Cyclobacteriaceae bacterium]
MSQITTHVLDTSKGQPAAGISVTLQKPDGPDQWQILSSGITDADGRVSGLLSAEQVLPPGSYRLVFATGAYYKKRNIKGFYPEVSIVFETLDEGHYHVPLLLNPFGYSTYRGS